MHEGRKTEPLQFRQEEQVRRGTQKEWDRLKSERGKQNYNRQKRQ
jgi:hypothetical protein